MEYPFNDEIFDQDNDEIFENNQLETESLWCNSLIDISEYDNQFFHDDANFDEVLTLNSNHAQAQDINHFSFEMEEEHHTALEIEMSPTHLKTESTFDYKQLNDMKSYQKLQNKSSSKPLIVQTLKDKSEPFFIENLTQNKQANVIHEFTNVKTDFITDNLDSMPTQLLFQKDDDENICVDDRTSNKKNIYYFNQFGNGSRRQKTPTIFLAKRNSMGIGRKPISRIRRQDNTPIFSIYQDVVDKPQTDRIKYSLSPSTSSPDSALDCSLSGNGFHHQFNDDVVSSIYPKPNDISNRFYEMKYKVEKSNREALYSSKISSSSRLFQSPIPQTGLLILTEEEKRTLLLENYPIPTRLPLTKQEERNLKKVRRKIKNKISAQESRRKKKEYMEALEKKVEVYVHENNDLKKRLENQENLNKSLLGQLRHLQQMLGRAGSNTASTCLMVFLLCFSLILVGMPNRLQTLRPPQSVIVSDIHKVGYGSISNIDRSQEMTAMQRYFPPDINGMLYNYHNYPTIIPQNESATSTDKGNEPIDSVFHVNNLLMTNQRKGILLENSKEEEDDCVQYGPKYLWWLLQSTNTGSPIDKSSMTEPVSNDLTQESFIDDNNLTLNVLSDILMDEALLDGNIETNQSHIQYSKKPMTNMTNDDLQMFGYLGLST